MDSTDIVVIGVKELKESTLDGAQVFIRPNGNTDFNSQTSIFLRNIPEGTTLNDLYGGLA